MAITTILIYYSITAITFETINCIVSWIKFKKKNVRAYEMFESLKKYARDVLKTDIFFKIIFKKYFRPITFLIGYTIFCYLSLFIFPFSLIKIFKKILIDKPEPEKELEYLGTIADEERDSLKNEEADNCPDLIEITKKP